MQNKDYGMNLSITFLGYSLDKGFFNIRVYLSENAEEKMNVFYCVVNIGVCFAYVERSL